MRKYQEEPIFILEARNISRKNISLEYLFSIQHKTLCDVACKHVFNLTPISPWHKDTTTNVPQPYQSPEIPGSLKGLGLVHDVFLLNTAHPHSSRISLEDFSLSLQNNSGITPLCHYYSSVCQYLLPWAQTFNYLSILCVWPILNVL